MSDTCFDVIQYSNERLILWLNLATSTIVVVTQQDRYLFVVRNTFCFCPCPSLVLWSNGCRGEETVFWGGGACRTSKYTSFSILVLVLGGGGVSCKGVGKQKKKMIKKRKQRGWKTKQKNDQNKTKQNSSYVRTSFCFVLLVEPHVCRLLCAAIASYIARGKK